MPSAQPDWLRRVVFVGTRKGGAGKSSVTAGIGAEAAAAGRRVLLIDGDTQGNLTGRDLGLDSDEGEGLTDTLLNGTPLKPIDTGRENLELIPGGIKIGRVAHIDWDKPEETITMEQGRAMRGHLAQALSALCAERRYHLVLIDAPPGDAPFVRTYLHPARYGIVPSPADTGSIDGIEYMSDLYDEAARINGTHTTFLGAVLFAPGSREGTKAVSYTLDELTQMLPADAGPFRSVIPAVKIAAEDSSSLGVTPREMVDAISERNRSVVAALRSKMAVDEEHRRLRTRENTITRLVSAYAGLTREVFERISNHEKGAH